MSLIIFLIVLSALVIVHELGHLSAAKYFGIRVDEFGLGYPPRAKSLFRWRKTDFTLNWLPFGGFVKIFGENPSEEPRQAASPDSFQSKNRGIQALVLVSGVVGNFLFAWALLSLGFMTGLPAPESLGLPLENPQTVITTVLPGSPAALAGVKPGDTILALSRGSAELAGPVAPEAAARFIGASSEPLALTLKRGQEVMVRSLVPEQGVWSENPAIGVAMEVVGTAQLPFFQSVWQGLATAAQLTFAIGKSLGQFFAQAFIGQADLSSVTGPVGLIGMVGEVSRLGWGHLISFTALISLNLCLINLMPFPALDGGRLLFVGIEALTRRPIPSRFFNLANAAGFALLILLMVLITIQDVRNIL